MKHENSKYGNATIGNGLPALRCILSFCIDKVVGWVRNPDKKNHADIGAAIAAEHICLAVAVHGVIISIRTGEISIVVTGWQEPVVIISLGYVNASRHVFLSGNR